MWMYVCPHESFVLVSAVHGLRAWLSVDQGWWSTIRFTNHPKEEVSEGLPTICFGVWMGCVNITQADVSTTKNLKPQQFGLLALQPLCVKEPQQVNKLTCTHTMRCESWSDAKEFHSLTNLRIILHGFGWGSQPTLKALLKQCTQLCRLVFLCDGNVPTHISPWGIGQGKGSVP